MKNKPASFVVSRADSALIAQIVKRAAAANPHLNLVSLNMDITACHVNGCPLRLVDLLAAPEGDFGHDVHGISRFIDRNTGKIPINKFQPRCAMSAEQVKAQKAAARRNAKLDARLDAMSSHFENEHETEGLTSLLDWAFSLLTLEQRVAFFAIERVKNLEKQAAKRTKEAA